MTDAQSISIHALLAESDTRQTCLQDAKQEFLSTLSLRRATSCTSIGRPKRLYFYPRSPCGERPLETLAGAFLFPISIHALLAESDFQTSKLCDLLLTFLSTLSLRRATRCRCRPVSRDRNFYPRSPCGERRRHSANCQAMQAFLSTLSLRRATSTSL